jgi:hypothetical protein
MNPLTRFARIVCICIVTGLWLSGDAARADELPADTNQIKSLTPEQADRLICKHERPDKRSVTFLRFTPVTERKANGIQITKLIPVECEGTYAFRGDFLSLPALKQITPETAAVLGRHHGVLHLDGMRALDADVASALAAFDGELLSLHGLEEMDAAVAKALAGSRARRLHLNGLTTLDADAAEALAEFRGDEISMSRVWGMIGKSIALTAGVSRMVCKSGDSSCILEGVTAIDAPDSVATAKALATRKGPLSLPNLKKISPKTLAALLEKEDVEIPLIETLELIPEPDSSRTEDFVIPEGLQQRQKQQAR